VASAGAVAASIQPPANTAKKNFNIIELPLYTVGAAAPQDADSIVELSSSSLKKWLPEPIRTRLSLINHALTLNVDQVRPTAAFFVQTVI
jgi:hypothetical protein